MKKSLFSKSLGFILFCTFFISNLQAKVDPCRIAEFKITDPDGQDHLAIIVKEDITHTGTITILLPPLTDAQKRSLKPEIKMHDPAAAKISPASGVAQDFTKQATYTVDCKNNKGKMLKYTYKVDVGAAKK